GTLPLPASRPNDPFTWFTESQLWSLFGNGSVPDWFHGIITRKTAEERLTLKPPGYFLIRVSESRVGYTLSYREDEHCRHFMIDVLEDGQYIILGENRTHRSLQDLVDFHCRNPIMPFNQVLTVACGKILKSKSMCPVLYVSDLQPAPNMRTSSPCIQPPEVPLRNHVVQKQNLVCSRTTSVSDNSSTPSATERKLFTNIQPVKLHDLRPSVAVNLKSLKKKFQKKMSNPQENVYAEITKGPNDSSEVIENEYQEITGELTFRVPPQHHTDARLNDQMLPQEYRSPPPFAPGY
uniref:Hematopoietic SH2 domain containing n=1 Tax=Xiphophorus couchianus TaxID=32473 RepID=A0A3B5LTJ5_9TELE